MSNHDVWETMVEEWGRRGRRESLSLLAALKISRCLHGIPPTLPDTFQSENDRQGHRVLNGCSICFACWRPRFDPQSSMVLKATSEHP